VIIMTPPVSELEDEIAHLRDLDLSGLRARWHSVFRRKAPDHLPRHLLYRMIAYRLQAERLGDLDRDTQRFLDQVAAGIRNGDELPAKGAPLTRHGLHPGTILVREWDGKSQRVMVLDEGFAWNGTTYRSLTEIAMRLPHRWRCVPAGNRRQVSIVYEIDDRHISVFRIVHLIPSQRRTAVSLNIRGATGPCRTGLCGNATGLCTLPRRNFAY
jgi:hypothetical protein